MEIESPTVQPAKFQWFKNLLVSKQFKILTKLALVFLGLVFSLNLFLSLWRFLIVAQVFNLTQWQFWRFLSKLVLSLNCWVMVVLMAVIDKNENLRLVFIQESKRISGRVWTFFNSKIVLFKNWLVCFLKASFKVKWEMSRKYLFWLIFLILVIKLAPFFFPPKIVKTFPADGAAEILLDTQIEIIFDRPMQKTLVEKAFAISPEISGQFNWEGTKFIFKPDQLLDRSRAYQVRFVGRIFSAFWMPLSGKKEFSFQTVGDPRVLLASPQEEALEAKTPITIMFDRAMVPLTTATGSAVQISPLKIDPEIPGEGRWLGTSAYQFRPAKPYPKGTDFKVTVLKGIRSQDGGVMLEDYSWTFSSERPKILGVTPISGYNFASPTASVAAFFSQIPTPTSAEGKFLLIAENGEVIKGKLKAIGQWLGFYPFSPLEREKKYQAKLFPGIQGREGPNGLEFSYSWSFKTAASPSITGSSPADGVTDVGEEHSIKVFFATPMKQASFKDRVKISPEPEKKPSLYFSTYQGNTLHIGTYLKRATTYTVTIDGAVTDQYGVTLGEPYQFTFTTGDYLPSVSLVPSGTYFGSFNQEIVPRIVAKVVNSNQVDYFLYKLKREDLLDLYRRRFEYQKGRPHTTWQNYNPEHLEKVYQWSETYEAEKNVPVHVITKVTGSEGQKLLPGFYFLDARLKGNSHDNLVIVISRSTFLAKKTDRQIFVWAVDQTSNQPVEGMKIELTDQWGSQLAEGITNQDGVFQKEVDLFKKDHLFIFGQKENERVALSTDWNSGIRSYDFGLPYHYSSQETKPWQARENYKIYLSLDRPIYRPGQTVYFKGIIREDEDGVYQKLSEKEKIGVKISDGRQREVYQQNLSLTSFGSFSDQFEISAEANLGFYQIEARFKEHVFRQQFQVEEYRRPDFALEVGPQKQDYLHGQVAKIDIHAGYYFGAPLPDREVNWTATTLDYNFRWDKDRRFEFGDPESYWSNPWWYYSQSRYWSGQKLTEGKGKTDAKGDLTISLPLDLSDFKTSQRVKVEAVVTDESNQAIAASDDFIAHKGGIYLGLKPTSYANRVDQEVQVEIVAVDPRGKEQGDIPATIEFYKRTYKSIREKNPDDGRFYWVNKPEDSLVATQEVVTGATGRATAAFVPQEGGNFRVVGKTKDSFDNEIKSATFLWVSGWGLSTSRENHDRIVLVTDKDEYLIGEKARIFVASPLSQAKALVTMERASVLDYQLADITTDNSLIEIEAKPAFSPNVFLSVALIKGGQEVKDPPQFKIGYREVRVIDKKQKIEVLFESDKPQYLPREKAKIRLKSRDALGYPVKTELAVALVDKAVWDLSGIELADIYETFYRPRNLEVASSQLLTVSLDRINANTNLGSKGGSGGGGGGGLETARTEFPETAYWNPHLVTNDQGEAEVEITLPDSLTTWRLSAVAVSDQTAVGSGTSELLVTKEVLIRPLLPRFVAVGDQPKLGAIVVNNSQQEQEVSVHLAGEGFEVQGKRDQSQVLGIGGQARFLWPVEIGKEEKIKVALEAEGNRQEFRDALEMEIPVLSYATPEVTATSGQAKNMAEEKIFLPPEVDSTQGRLEISLSPSLSAGAQKGFKYLESFPYECAEQISSRLLAAVFIARAMKEAGTEKVADLAQKDLETTVNLAVQKLNNYQHPDGGWGWWINFRSDPFISAYAFQALWEAKKDGFVVDDSVIEKAKGYLESRLSAAGDFRFNQNVRAFTLYVLSLAGVKNESYLTSLFEKRFEITLAARAYLALAMEETNLKQEQKRILSELVSLVKKTATSSHWEEDSPAYFLMGGNTTTTAVILEALVSLDAKNPLIDEVVRYLMAARRDGHWRCTRETATVIKALIKQFLSSGEGKVDLDYFVRFNEKDLLSGQFGKENIFDLIEKEVAIDQLKIGEENRFQIGKTGRGNLYYNLNLNYFLPYEKIDPLERGMVIIRELIDSQGQLLDQEEIKAGQDLWVRLIIVAPQETHYAVIEDKLPAGFESVNESLKTTSILNVQKPVLKEKENRFLYFNHQELRDDQTVLFADFLPQGVYEYTYRVRATLPGRYHYPPARVYQMYFPDVFGHSSGDWLTITE